MPQHTKIEFIESDTPITQPVTKFGGQPVWLTKPEWPLSRSSGKPMQFIAQIALDETLWPGTAGKMAYLFMTDDEDGGLATWEADGGENALIIQPSTAELPVEVAANIAGSALCRWEDSGNRRIPKPCEYAVRLILGEEPVWQDEDARVAWDEPTFEQYVIAMEGNKLGGGPFFLQSDEFPEGDGWRLLLQLDSVSVPFEVNFGDAGVGYAFIDAAGERGRFLWQCC